IVFVPNGSQLQGTAWLSTKQEVALKEPPASSRTLPYAQIRVYTSGAFRAASRLCPKWKPTPRHCLAKHKAGGGLKGTAC
ncbi:MAG: hypothetical protein KBG76_16335, partial [Saprospiraceae bacterium]|nr:hypothetical protein [Saprospiraceae bacterium]